MYILVPFSTEKPVLCFSFLLFEQADLPCLAPEDPGIYKCISFELLPDNLSNLHGQNVFASHVQSEFNETKILKNFFAISVSIIY